jgi:hypothetical protein
MADYEGLARRLLQSPPEVPAGPRINAQTLKWDPLMTDPQPMPGDPVMKPWEPRSVMDNVAPMVSDVASGLGVPPTIANRLGGEVPTAARRDAMQAAYRETLPGSSVGEPWETSAFMSLMRPGIKTPERDAGIENFRRMYFGKDRGYPGASNVNSRNDLRSRGLTVVE